MVNIRPKGLDDIRKPKKKCDIRKAKRLADGFVRGMRKAYSHFDDGAQDTANIQDIATEIEIMVDELENVEDPLQIANLADDIDDVISKLGI